jgi:alpha-L-rhamnosidase
MHTEILNRHGVSSAKNFTLQQHVVARGVFSTLLLALAAGHTLAASGAQVTGLRCEYLANPLGLDVLQPRLNWRLASERRGERQTAYRVIAASSLKRLDQDQGDFWDSGKVNSDQSLQVEYAGKPLGSEQCCYWKVRVWDKDGGSSPWSQARFWTMGLLAESDWKAKWIGLNGGDQGGGSEHRRLPARHLRREFRVEKKIAQATAYVCGLGFFELYLNGHKVSDHVMDPTPGNYSKRVMYVTFDVAEHLKPGPNAIGVLLGNSRFYAPRTQVPTWTPNFGYPKLRLRLAIKYADGSTTDVVSDESWKITDHGPIRANNEFDGEEYDARMELGGWDRASFDDSKWQPVQLVQPPGGRLDAQMLEPMRVTQVLKPVAITNPKPGMYLVDFGQNLYGMVRLKVRGPAGTRVQLRTSFTKKTDGTIKMEDNRSALSTDVYVMKGKGKEVWAPRFRGQGTHFVEVTGWPGVPTPNDFEFLVVHTDMEKAGEFTCSNELINRIYANVERSTRMQNRGVPLDPDRDERQAWLGHPAKTSESEAWQFNVAPFYTSFLAETRLDQRADGNLSDAGSVWPFNSGDPTWPSVITILPEWFYNFYGDRRILEQNYETAKRWMQFQEKRNLGSDFTLSRGVYGDWVDAASMDGRVPDFGATSKPLMWSAYFHHNCRLMARAAGLLGKADDQRHFAALAEQTAVAFHRRFFDPERNKYESGTQCSYVLPLAFGLLPPDHHAAVVSNLVDEIMVKHQGHLSVGLVGMQWFMQTLTDIGHPEVAWTVATRTTRPSWGYMIAKGGSSVWERWDQDTRDPGMNGESQLILAGNLQAWFYQTLGGINYDPERPGFKHIILRPRPVGDLTFVKASHRSLHGPIVSEWRIKDDSFRWKISVPPNTTASIYVPARDPASVREGGRPAAQSPGVKFLRAEPGTAIYEVGAGSYTFTSARSTATGRDGGRLAGKSG